MNLIKLMLVLCFNFYLTTCKQPECQNGLKILTRQTIKHSSGQKSYKLTNKCLCPHDYYGIQCQYNSEISCYLISLQNLSSINASNIRQQMQYDLSFSMQCWVGYSRFRGSLQLREYLSKYNDLNGFGVRNQFGADYQIVWANSTDIFNDKAELIYQKQSETEQNITEPTQEQILKILIGNNSKLYDEPFVYKDHFLGYGLSNGTIVYQIKIIDPEYGVHNYLNFSNSQISITGVEEYLNSYSNIEQLQKKRKDLIQNITDNYNKDQLEEIVKQFINSGKRPNNIPNPTDLKDQIAKPLPQAKITVKINPYSQTFYQNIKVQLDISEHFNDNLTSYLSLNGLEWTIPVNVDDLGLPSPTKKELTVTDQDNKSYFKIVFAVLILGLIYLSLTYGYKRYKKWKIKQYTTFQNTDHQKLNQQSALKSSLSSSNTTQHSQQTDKIKNNMINENSNFIENH